MAHPMQHYGDRTPSDGTLHIYARQGDIPRSARGKRNAATIGAALFGQRFDDVTFTDYALFEINNALRTIEWLRQLECRFSETPEALQKILDIIDGEDDDT